MKIILALLIVLLFPSLAWACGPMFSPTYPLDFLVTGAVAGAVTLLVMRRADPNMERSAQLLLVGAWALMSCFAGGLLASKFGYEIGVFARLSFGLYMLSVLSVFTAQSSRLGKLMLSAVIVGGIFFSMILFLETSNSNNHYPDKFRQPAVETQVTF